MDRAGHIGWCAVVALAGVLTAGCGSVPSGGACPMWRQSPVVSVDASAYVAAHPGRVASMGACVVTGNSPCDDAAAARHRVPAAGAPAVLRLPALEPGTYRVHVVLDDATGKTVLATTGELTVRHTDGGRCKNRVGDYGTSRLDAHGRLSTT